MYAILEDYTAGPDSPPSQVITGRLIATGPRTTVLAKYALRDRKMIGNTSMDPEMAFLMANAAMLRKGSVMFDPYVGSGL